MLAACSMLAVYPAAGFLPDPAPDAHEIRSVPRSQSRGRSALDPTRISNQGGSAPLLLLVGRSALQYIAKHRPEPAAMGPGQVAHDVETRRQTAHLHRWCQALQAGVHRDSLCPELDDRYGPFLPGQYQGPGDSVTGVPPQLLISCILLTVSPP